MDFHMQILVLLTIHKLTGVKNHMLTHRPFVNVTLVYINLG